MKILNRLADRFSKIQPLPVGTHHLQTTQDDKPYRLHLRLRDDGSGLLILNASTVLHLNPTASEYAFHFIKGTVPEEKRRNKSPRVIESTKHWRSKTTKTSRIESIP
jgi:hypothetical protein